MKRIGNISLGLLLLFSFSAKGQVSDYMLGRAHMEKQQYDSALFFLNKALVAKPGNADYLFHRGMAYFEQRNYELALTDFLHLRQRQSGRAGFMLAKIESRMKHPELAVKYLKENLGSRYKVEEKVLLLDSDIEAISTSAAWKALWEEKDWYSDYDRELQEASYHMNFEEYPEALNLLERLDKKAYKRSIVKSHKAKIYHSNGNLKQALKEAEVAAKDYRNYEAQMFYIDLLQEEEEYEEAFDRCEKLLRQKPDAFPYYLVAAELAGKQGRYTEGQDYANTYIELFPGKFEGYLSLADLHYAQKKYLNSLKAINKALELEQGEDELFLLRGKCFAATRMHANAAKDFSMALDLNPQNGECWFEKGLANIEMNDYPGACHDFKKALQYGHHEAREYIDKYCD